MDITTLMGTIGAILVLIAFLMEQINKWKNDDLIYDFTNFLGSLFLLIYAYSLNSLPFLIVNTVWGLFSLIDVFKDLTKKNKTFR